MMERRKGGSGRREPPVGTSSPAARLKDDANVIFGVRIRHAAAVAMLPFDAFIRARLSFFSAASRAGRCSEFLLIHRRHSFF
jgi:hypothetical protein